MHEAMTVEQLSAEIDRLNADFEVAKREFKSRALVATAARDSKIALTKMREAIGGMTDTDKAALLQVLGANGITSGEAVGVPGAK